MWALPDISRMNSEAHQNRKKFERAAKTGILGRKRIRCEHEDEKCQGEVRTYLWYDIFSDDPKGVIGVCELHDGYYGSPTEGFFYCDGCERVMIENITWELYRHDDEDGTLCLPCYAERELENEENWLALTDEAIDSLTFDRVRKAKHLIGVKMPTPKGISFVNNVELDGSTGGRLTGFNSCESTPDGGVAELKRILWRLQDEGHTRAILILDAAYQFAVSIGVYVPAIDPQTAQIA